MDITVGISCMEISKRKNDVLVTHSLGSCLGLTAFDPAAGVGGLIHCLLPQPGPGQDAAREPYKFVTHGVPRMIRRMYDMGARKDRLVLKAAGCSSMLNLKNTFNMGGKNQEALLRLLEKNGIKLAASDMGGSKPRTVRLHMNTGKVLVTSRKEMWEL